MPRQITPIAKKLHLSAVDPDESGEVYGFVWNDSHQPGEIEYWLVHGAGHQTNLKLVEPGKVTELKR